LAREVFDFLVVIPTFRRPALLAQAIESAVNQAGASKKIIVVDDCPQGSARGVAARFEEAGVVYLQAPQASGGRPGKVRNHGFETSVAMGIEAPFVHFLDDDDIAPPGHYAAAKAEFARYPEAGVLFGILQPFCDFAQDEDLRPRQETQLAQARRWRANAARIARTYQRLGAIGRWLFALQAMFGPELFLCSGGLIRHECVARLGGFDPTYRFMEDYEFYTRAMRAHGVRFVDRVFALYRLGSAGSLWSPVELAPKAAMERDLEIAQILRSRQKEIRREVASAPRFLAWKLAYRAVIQPLAYQTMRVARPSQ
jgi:GT2 family glycosyltransferase